MSCGAMTSEWVGSAGSVWTGVLDPGTANETPFTLTVLPELLGVRLAATVMVAQTGAGVWVHDGSFRWTSTLAGVWDLRFEAAAVSCSGGQVTAAAGGATDSLQTVHPFTLTRVS